MSEPDLPPAGSYSRAFENLVTNGDGDIVGLLAYGLFKQAVREAARNGDVASGVNRNPSATMVSVHRDAAEQRLSELVDIAIENARPDIESSALRRSVETSEAAVKAHIDRRTGFWIAVVAGIVAWVLSLIVTIAIIWLAGKGDSVSALLKG